jgi:hypothetical protein
MMKKFMMLAVFLTWCGTTTTFAQWRVGVTAEADYNTHTMDLQYMNDFRLEPVGHVVLSCQQLAFLQE